MGQVLQAGQGQIPSRQAQIHGGHPEGGLLRDGQQGLRLGHPRRRRARRLDPRRRPRASPWAAAWSRCRRLLTCCPRRASASAWATPRRSTRWSTTACATRSRGKQMFEEATEVGDELEMTRADMDRWALRSHERVIAATDDGRLPEEIVPVTISGRKGDTVVEVDESPRRDTSLERLAKLPGLRGRDGSHTAGNSPGVNDGAGALVLASDEWAEREGKEVAGHDRRPGGGGRRLRLARPHAGQRGPEGARQGRPAARRHRPVGDQRGVRLGDAELDPDARDRRGQGQRQRRRGGASGTRSAPPARASSARWCTSCAAAAAATAARRSARAAGRATP